MMRASGSLKCVSESDCEGHQPSDFEHKLIVFDLHFLLCTSGLLCFLYFQRGIVRLLIHTYIIFLSRKQMRPALGQ